MSRMVWCEAGHTYDKEANTTCPHCGKSSSGAGRDERLLAGSSHSAFRPVVAWLVCTAGGETGRDYRLCDGPNSLGRDLSSRVCIACDLEVAPKNHAQVFHEPETSRTWLVPGSDQNVVYLNEVLALQPVRLKAHDVIALGNTRLVFIPFCSDRFRWGGPLGVPASGPEPGPGASPPSLPRGG